MTLQHVARVVGGLRAKGRMDLIQNNSFDSEVSFVYIVNTQVDLMRLRMEKDAIIPSVA